MNRRATVSRVWHSSRMLRAACSCSAAEAALLEEPRVAHDRAEAVAHLVDDAGGQLARPGHRLGVVHEVLHPAPLGLVLAPARLALVAQPLHGLLVGAERRGGGGRRAAVAPGQEGQAPEKGQEADGQPVAHEQRSTVAQVLDEGGRVGGHPHHEGRPLRTARARR